MTASITHRPQFNRYAAAWGILGVAVLLGNATFRLGERAYVAITWEDGLSAWYIGAGVLWLLVSLYAEGYRAFHMRFCPRVVARAHYLAHNPTPIRVIFAPLFCMALFHATRRGKIAAWAVLFMVVALVLVISQVPQPARGLIDLGVAAALAWGVVSLLYFAALAAMGRAIDADPQLPAGSGAESKAASAGE